MKKKTVITLIIIIALLIIMPIVAKFGLQDNPNIPSKSLTKCIASKATIYTTETCIYCKKQERMFGENYKYLNVIDCKKEPLKCIEAGITGTPTWVIDGQQLPGVQSLEKLKEVTNCG